MHTRRGDPGDEAIYYMSQCSSTIMPQGKYTHQTLYIVSLCLFRTGFPSSLASPQDEECSRQLQLDPDTRSDVEETDRELSVTFQRDQLPIMTVSLNAEEFRNGTAFCFVQAYLNKLST